MRGFHYENHNSRIGSDNFPSDFCLLQSPSSPSTESSSSISSSSGISSSSLPGIAGRACEYTGEDFGINGLFLCGEAPSDMPDLQKYKNECEEEERALVNDCPSGEKITCIAEEDKYENVLYKIYADGFACGDFMMKNADGSEGIVSKGGACGPFVLGENVPISMCVEFPEFPTGIIKLSCAYLEAPFANECPGNADLSCYDPEEEAITNLYGEAVSSFTCEDFGWEDL